MRILYTCTGLSASENKEDAIETFAVSEEVYEESTNDISFAGRLLQSILQLFAPLL